MGCHGMTQKIWSYLIVMVTVLCTLQGCSEGIETGGIRGGQWESLEPLLKPRRGFSAITRGSRIYVIGGMGEDGYLRECEWTTIRADGTIEEWKGSSPLNIERVYAGVVAFNRYIYVIGGAGGKDGKPLDTVERARIRSDGSLGEWILEENRLTTPRFGVTAIVSGGYIYAIGGYGENLLGTIERARIMPDGSLGRWQVVAHLPRPSYMHTAIKHRDHIYLLGGRTHRGGLRDVFFTELKADGTLREWQTLMPLSSPRYGLSATVIGDRIYVGGGEDTHHIESASMKTDGTLSQWKKTLRLPLKMKRAVMVAYRDVIYLIGGIHDGKYLRDVYATRVE